MIFILKDILISLKSNIKRREITLSTSAYKLQYNEKLHNECGPKELFCSLKNLVVKILDILTQEKPQLLQF